MTSVPENKYTASSSVLHSIEVRAQPSDFFVHLIIPWLGNYYEYNSIVSFAARIIPKISHLRLLEFLLSVSLSFPFLFAESFGDPLSKFQHPFGILRSLFDRGCDHHTPKLV